MPVRQSAYRLYHSTETAVTKVFDKLLQAADEGDPYPPSVSLTSQQILTPWATTSCYWSLSISLACVASCRSGSSCIYVTEYFKSFIMVVHRILFTSRALCHKVRYSACGCSSCTLLILKRRLMSTALTIMLLPTIRSWMSIVVAMICRLLLGNLNTVSQISITGCQHTASSKIQWRQNSCGRVSSRVWVNLMVMARQSSLALTPLSPVDMYASHELFCRLIWVLRNMSQPSVLLASFISDRFIVFSSH